MLEQGNLVPHVSFLSLFVLWGELLLCWVQTVVVDMLRDEMKKHTESEGFIVVGFPRNISQVKSLVGNV